MIVLGEALARDPGDLWPFRGRNAVHDGSYFPVPYKTPSSVLCGKHVPLEHRDHGKPLVESLTPIDLFSTTKHLKTILDLLHVLYRTSHYLSLSMVGELQ